RPDQRTWAKARDWMSLLGRRFRFRFLLLRLRRDYLYIMQSTEVPIVDFGCDLIADFNFLEHILFVWDIGHGHRIHPALNLFAVNGESFVREVDFLHFTFEDVLFLPRRRRILVLLSIPACQEQPQRQSCKSDFFHWYLHRQNFTTGRHCTRTVIRSA